MCYCLVINVFCFNISVIQKNRPGYIQNVVWNFGVEDETWALQDVFLEQLGE